MSESQSPSLATTASSQRSKRKAAAPHEAESPTKKPSRSKVESDQAVLVSQPRSTARQDTQSEHGDNDSTNDAVDSHIYGSSIVSCIGWEAHWQRHPKEQASKKPLLATGSNANVQSQDCADWETRYQCGVRKRERSSALEKSENFVAVLVANFQSRKAINDLDARINQYQKTCDGIRNGIGGLVELEERIYKFRERNDPQDDEALKDAIRRLDRCNRAIDIQTRKIQEADRLFENSVDDQLFRDARLYELADGMEIAPSSVLIDFPVEFWNQLYACKAFSEAAKAVKSELSEASIEREDLLNQIDKLRPAAGASGPNESAAASDDNKLLANASRRDGLEQKARDFQHNERQALQTLHLLAKPYLVRRGLLPWVNASSIDQATLPPLQRPEKMQCLCTPVDEAAFDDPDAPPLMQDPLDFDAVSEKLKRLLKQEFEAARKEYLDCGDRLDDMRNGCADPELEQNCEDEESFARAYFLQKASRTRAFDAADHALEDVITRAQEARVVGQGIYNDRVDEEENVDCFQDIPEADEDKHRVLDSDDPIITEWAVQAHKAGARGFHDWEFSPKYNDIEPCISSEQPRFFMVKSLFEARSVQFGESESTIGDDTRRTRLLRRFMEEWRDGEDGFVGR